MVNRPTVFILGAGASKPYAFPLSRELTVQVLTNLESPDRAILWDELGIKQSERLKFAEALRLSGKYSVDAFLERREEFLDIGKVAIAMTLIAHEEPKILFEHCRPQDWYAYLFSKLDTSFEEFANNRVSFITYNYDRSLEHFLFTALQNSHGRSDVECAETLQRIPIVHVHGSLGSYPGLGEPSLEYGPLVTREAITLAANSIRIIHENGEDTAEYTMARQLLKSAERIYFLGFGFDSTNVRRLRYFHENWEPDPENSVFVRGTAHGLTDMECQDIGHSLFSDRLELSRKFGALEFLREVVSWHDLGSGQSAPK